MQQTQHHVILLYLPQMVRTRCSAGRDPAADWTFRPHHQPNDFHFRLNVPWNTETIVIYPPPALLSRNNKVRKRRRPVHMKRACTCTYIIYYIMYMAGSFLYASGPQRRLHVIFYKFFPRLPLQSTVVAHTIFKSLRRQYSRRGAVRIYYRHRIYIYYFTWHFFLAFSSIRYFFYY